MLFKEYSRVFSPKKFFPSGPLFHVLKIKTLSESSYSKKPPLLWKNPGCAADYCANNEKDLLYPCKIHFIFSIQLYLQHFVIEKIINFALPLVEARYC